MLLAASQASTPPQHPPVAEQSAPAVLGPWQPLPSAESEADVAAGGASDVVLDSELPLIHVSTG